ncbi:MAG TPA: CvpA family protein, partial [bacterium]|nr:CvpA family protein [bacterium]
LIDEASKLVGAVAGIYIAVIKYQPVSNYFEGFFTNYPGVRMVISFLLIFLVVYFAVQFVGHLISSALKKLKLSWINRSLGGFFGALKAMVVMVVIVWLISTFQSLGLDKRLRGASVSYMFVKDVQEYVSRSFNVEQELDHMNKSLRKMFMLNNKPEKKSRNGRK